MDDVYNMRRVVNAVILLIALSILVNAKSVSLGSTTDVKELTINKGQQKVFQASFFNMGSEPIQLDLKVEHPSDIRVEVYPESITILGGTTTSPEATSDNGWFILSDGKTYVRTYPVYVYVRAPAATSRNSYNIKLVATASSGVEHSQVGIKQTVLQVREVMFTAYVPGPTEVNPNTITITETRGSNKKPEPEPPAPEVRVISQSQLANPQITSGPSTSSGQANQEPVEVIKKPAPQAQTTTMQKPAMEIPLPTGKIVLSEDEVESASHLSTIVFILTAASLIRKITR